MALRICVIGYKNHAGRLIRLLSDLESVGTIEIFHPDIEKVKKSLRSFSGKVSGTDDWSSLTTSDAFVISSPNETHVEYLRKIKQLSSTTDTFPYVYCEKPCGTSDEELIWLDKQDEKIKKKILFGFNYRFSPIYRKMKELVHSKKYDDPIYANFISTHGLAFKTSTANDWRFNSNNLFSRITGNVGIHYVDMAIGLFGDVKHIIVKEKKVAGHSAVDSCIITMFFRGGITANIFLSYASVFSKSSEIYMTNGLLRSDETNIKLYHPRDTLNSMGEFCSPEPIIINVKSRDRSEETGLTGIINHFVETSKNKTSFNIDDFSMSLKATELLLSAEFRD